MARLNSDRILICESNKGKISIIDINDWEIKGSLTVVTNKMFNEMKRVMGGKNEYAVSSASGLFFI